MRAKGIHYDTSRTPARPPPIPIGRSQSCSQATLQCSLGLDGFTIIGLPDSSTSRVRSFPTRLRTSAPST